MSWTAPSGHVWTTGEVVTAANMNTYIANNLTFIGGTAGAIVTTSQTTASTSWTDLATAGPAVTVTTMTTALVIMGAQASNNTANDINAVTVAVTGASTITAGTAPAWEGSHATATGVEGSTYGFVLTGLTAGSNTFTLKYEVNGGTGTFSNRVISVIPLTT